MRIATAPAAVAPAARLRRSPGFAGHPPAVRPSQPLSHPADPPQRTAASDGRGGPIATPAGITARSGFSGLPEQGRPPRRPPAPHQQIRKAPWPQAPAPSRQLQACGLPRWFRARATAAPAEQTPWPFGLTTSAPALSSDKPPGPFQGKRLPQAPAPSRQLQACGLPCWFRARATAAPAEQTPWPSGLTSSAPAPSSDTPPGPFPGQRLPQRSIRHDHRPHLPHQGYNNPSFPGGRTPA